MTTGSYFLTSKAFNYFGDRQDEIHFAFDPPSTRRTILSRLHCMNLQWSIAKDSDVALLFYIAIFTLRCHSPAMKHKKTVAYIISNEKHRPRDQKLALIFFQFLGVICHFSINIRIELHFLFCLHWEIKGNWSRVNLWEALHDSQDLHVTSVLSFPNANKKKCTSILKCMIQQSISFYLTTWCKVYQY